MNKHDCWTFPPDITVSAASIFLGIAWLIVGLFSLRIAVEHLGHYQLKANSIPGLTWILLSLILWNPIWRLSWRVFPSLGKVIFPDLNGEWDVELRTNWPRQMQLVEAAAGLAPKFDIRKCDEEILIPLTTILLKAEIHQTWLKFEMRLWNPNRDTPIERSTTLNVDQTKT